GLFFVLLMVAALTSTISMLEVPVSYLIDDRKWSRKKAAWVVGIAAMIFSVPSALSSIEGNVFAEIRFDFLGNELVGFFGIMDFIFGSFAVILISLMLAVYTGWIKKIGDFADELALGAPGFVGVYRRAWIFFIKWICPLVILILLLKMLGVFELA
ncbi:MAG: sodium-dependent transporter, partial [Bacteroidetes bacterium]|nr:sodium-dependent transporter [Bacteroidota bacterium]